MSDEDLSLSKPEEQTTPHSDSCEQMVQPLKSIGTRLLRVAPTLKHGLMLLGLVLGVGRSATTLGTSSNVFAVVGAVFELLIWTLLLGGLGWFLNHWLHVVADLFDFLERRSLADAGRDQRLLAELERIATKLDRPAEPRHVVAAPTSTVEDAEIRKAIRQGQWRQAEELLQSLEEESPGDPRIAHFSGELRHGMEAAVGPLQAKLAAAREVSDTDRVLELHEELDLVLSPDAKKTLNVELARWFMGLIQKRLRAGTVRPDVVVLSGKVAERFDTTSEGASLRAALPTLRRSAGLCARCGDPYKGVADACPKCLGASAHPAADGEELAYGDPSAREDV